MKLPWPIKQGLHFTEGVLLAPKESVRKPLLPVENATSLHQFGQGFVFFSPATLYLARVIEGDLPWADFCREFAIDMPFYHYRFNHAIFDGLQTRDGDVSWNHVLWAVPRSAWPCFAAYVNSLTFMHPTPAGQFDVALLQDLSIRDVLALDHGIEPQAPVGCCAFVVTGGRFSCAFTRVTTDGRHVCRWAGPSPHAKKMYENILEGRGPWEGING